MENSQFAHDSNTVCPHLVWKTSCVHGGIGLVLLRALYVRKKFPGAIAQGRIVVELCKQFSCLVCLLVLLHENVTVTLIYTPLATEKNSDTHMMAVNPA